MYIHIYREREKPAWYKTSFNDRISSLEICPYLKLALYKYISINNKMVKIIYYFCSGWLDIWIYNRRCSNRADYPRAGMEIRISNTGPTPISGVCTFGWASLNDPNEEMVYWAFGDPIQLKKPIHFYSQWEAPISSIPGLLMASCVGPTLHSRDFLCYTTGVLYHHQLLFLAQGQYKTLFFFPILLITKKVTRYTGEILHTVGYHLPRTKPA